MEIRDSIREEGDKTRQTVREESEKTRKELGEKIDLVGEKVDKVGGEGGSASFRSEGVHGVKPQRDTGRNSRN